MAPDGELLTQVVNPSRWCSRREMEKRRRVIVDGRSEVWKRFVVLPNTDGQKYTIGKRFTRREQQGELILLSEQCLERIVMRGNAVCEIICTKNKYWVMPAEENVIFINGVKIVKRTVMKFGDVLSFPQKPMAFNRKEEGYEIVRFLFQERELIPDAFAFSTARSRRNIRQKERMIEKDAEFRIRLEATKKGIPQHVPEDTDNCEVMVGLNPLILSQIMSYLPVSELQHFRLVSQLWNEEANKVIRKRTSAVVVFQTQRTESSNFFQFVQDTKVNYIPNWKFCVTNLGNLGHHFASRWISDLDWFLQCRIHIVRRLELDGIIIFRTDFDLRIRILQKLHETLEDLTISGDWIVDIPVGVQQFPATLKFPKLQKFMFAVSRRMYAPGYIYIETENRFGWVEQLIEAVSGVKSLSLKNDRRLNEMFLSKLNSFQNLEEISLHTTTPSAMTWLLNLNQSIKTMELNKLDIPSKEDISLFDLLLEKHSKTLTKLQFILPAPPGPRIHIFPAFPNLLELSVGRGGEYIPNNRTTTTIVFEREMYLNYERIFPRLQSLTLNPDPCFNFHFSWLDPAEVWKTHADFLNNFFPVDRQVPAGFVVKAPEQICKTLVHLELPAISGEKIFPRAGELSEMFPGVHNEWMKKVREPPLPEIRQMVLRSASKKDSKTDRGDTSST